MSDPKDPNPLRDRLEALLKRAREISAEIERRVEAVTSEPATPHEGAAPTADASGSQPAQVEAAVPPDLVAAKEALEVATEAVAVTAEAAAVTAEALGAIAKDTAMTSTPVPPVEPQPATTTVPEVAIVSGPHAPASVPTTAAPLPPAEPKPADEPAAEEPNPPTSKT